MTICQIAGVDSLRIGTQKKDHWELKSPRKFVEKERFCQDFEGWVESRGGREEKSILEKSIQEKIQKMENASVLRAVNNANCNSGCCLSCIRHYSQQLTFNNSLDSHIIQIITIIITFLQARRLRLREVLSYLPKGTADKGLSRNLSLETTHSATASLTVARRVDFLERCIGGRAQRIWNTIVQTWTWFCGHGKSLNVFEQGSGSAFRVLN